jgi:hypothetical protein
MLGKSVLSCSPQPPGVALSLGRASKRKSPGGGLPGERRKTWRRIQNITERNPLVDLQVGSGAGILSDTTRPAGRTSVETFPEKWNPFCAARKLNTNLEKVPRTPPKWGLVGRIRSYVLLFTLLPLLNGGVKEMFNTMSEERKPGRPVSARTLSRAKKAAMIPDAAVLEVWTHWIQVMRNESKRKPVLDATRKQILGAAIHDYEVQGCKDAIDGCALSEFHMGRNKMNKRYDSVELIFRDSEHVEKFHEILDKSTEGKGDW